MDTWARASGGQQSSQLSDMDVDPVRVGIEMAIPHVFENDCSCDHLIGTAHQTLEHA